jgi:FolB domain-containing protein
MDKIHLRDLTVRTVIGTLPHERTAPQSVVFNITLECDTRAAAAADDLFQAVNYLDVHDRIVELCEQSSFLLIETLAAKTAELCLSFEGVSRVTVVLDKPRALSRAGAAVEITREN